jgi:hypothetical protein
MFVAFAALVAALIGASVRLLPDDAALSPR